MPSQAHPFRQHYRPVGARTPSWLRRVWIWF